MSKDETKNTTPPQQTPEEKAAAEKAAAEKAAAEKRAAYKGNVIVSLSTSIAFDGLALRPVIKPRKKGEKPVVEPVRAVVPAEIARAHGLEIIESAPKGAKIGVIVPEKPKA